MKNSIFIIWTGSLIFAFALGYFINLATINSNQELIAEARVSNLTELKVNSFEAKNVSHFTLRLNKTINKERVSKPAKAKNVVNELKELFINSGFSMDFSAYAKSYELVKGLSEQEIIIALSQLQSSLNQPKNLTTLMVLISRYAEINPIHSIDFVEANIHSTRAKLTAMSTIISSWSKNKPTDAYYWNKIHADNNPHDEAQKISPYSLLPIFNGLAKQDLNDAYDKLAEVEQEGKDTRLAAMGLANALESSEDFVTFMDRTNEFENVAVQGAGISSWINHNAQEAISWLDSIEESTSKNKMQERALSTWMQSEPKVAADWYLSNASEKNKQLYAERVVRNWSYSAPKTALNWINQQSAINTQKSTKKLLESTAFSNSKFTSENLYLLTNEKDKQSISFRIYSSLDRNNKRKAANFLESSPYKEHIIKLTRDINASKKSR